MTAMTRSMRMTGMVSWRTGTPVVHSGSPSRQILRSCMATSRNGLAPAGRTAPTMSSGIAVGAVTGRIWPRATQPEPSCSFAHSTRSAKDRSASSCQSDSSMCSQSTSASASPAWRRARSVRVGMPPSSHPRRRAQPAADRDHSGRPAPGPGLARPPEPAGRVICSWPVARFGTVGVGPIPAGNVASVTEGEGGSGGARVPHGGAHAVAAARRHGVETMFTLSGGHVFPLYDGAVTADPPMRIVDVRHEQTAVFAAEATARLSLTPGLAVLTAGPGVTNGMSAITTAHFNGSPLVVIAGRAPDYRWGSGSLQEIDHPLLLPAITKRAWTEHETARIGPATDEAFRIATARHRGPVFLDASLEALFGAAPAELGGPAGPDTGADPPDQPDPAAVDRIAGLLARASRPVLVLGSDVWLDGAHEAARTAAEELRLPGVAKRQGRGILPAGHELLVSRARSTALGEADLVIVAGTPLDFRLGYGEDGGKNGTPPAQVVHGT